MNIFDCTSFKVWDISIGCTPSFCLFFSDLSFICFITFVTYQDKRKLLWLTWSSVFKKTFFPGSCIIKGGFSSDVESDSTAISASVESISYGVILFLASSIPYLYGDDGIIYNNFFLLEICTDCRLHFCRFGSLSISHQQTCFTNIGVTQYHNL